MGSWNFFFLLLFYISPHQFTYFKNIFFIKSISENETLIVFKITAVFSVLNCHFFLYPKFCEFTCKPNSKCLYPNQQRTCIVGNYLILCKKKMLLIHNIEMLNCNLLILCKQFYRHI